MLCCGFRGKEKRKKKKGFLKRKFHTVFANIFCKYIPAAKLKTMQDSSVETENPDIWPGLSAF